MPLPFLPDDVLMHGRNYQEKPLSRKGEELGEERALPYHAQLPSRVTGDKGYKRGWSVEGHILALLLNWREEDTASSYWA